jgi:hypothetical protein
MKARHDRPEYRRTAPAGFAESRTLMPLGSAATSTQLPLPMLWRDLRQATASCTPGPVDMWITLFRKQQESSSYQALIRTRKTHGGGRDGTQAKRAWAGRPVRAGTLRGVRTALTSRKIRKRDTGPGSDAYRAETSIAVENRA